jgi:hypothetical protein
MISFVALFARPCQKLIECLHVVRVNSSEMPPYRFDFGSVDAEQFRHISLVSNASRRKLELNETWKGYVYEGSLACPHGLGMANGCGRRIGCGAGTFSFRKNVHLHSSFTVMKLWPAAGRLRQFLESCNRGCAQELLDTVLRQNDVYILSDAPDETMVPNGPAAPQDRADVTGRQNVIDCFDYSAVPTWQVLRCEHGLSPCQELVSQVKPVGQVP